MSLLRGVAILMAFHRGADYLSEAIESILIQTYKNFDFFIVDDASDAEGRAILAKYAKKDSRIRIIKNEKNIGLTASLNKCFAFINAPYVARMDADDISHPERLEKQVAFLEANPDVAVVGSGIDIIDENARIFDSWQPVPDHEQLWKETTTVGPPFAHPTALIRRSALEGIGGYRLAFWYAQDYDLWLRLGEQQRFACLQEKLLCYRQPQKGFSPEKRVPQSIMHVAALACWCVRQQGLPDPIGEDDTIIDYPTMERLANMAGAPAWIAWLRNIIESPLWPERENALIEAWARVSSYQTDIESDALLELLVERTKSMGPSQFVLNRYAEIVSKAEAKKLIEPLQHIKDLQSRLNSANEYVSCLEKNISELELAVDKYKIIEPIERVFFKPSSLTRRLLLKISNYFDATKDGAR